MRLTSGISADVVGMAGGNDSVSVTVNIHWPNGAYAKRTITLEPDQRFTLDSDELLVIDTRADRSARDLEGNPRVVCRASTVKMAKVIRDLLNNQPLVKAES